MRSPIANAASIATAASARGVRRSGLGGAASIAVGRWRGGRVGLGGLATGAARVSEKHANFIVASPGARAADVVSGLKTRVSHKSHRSQRGDVRAGVGSGGRVEVAVGHKAGGRYGRSDVRAS